MKEAWQATLDDEDLTSTYADTSGFQTWGDNTLVYKSTLIEKTGHVSSTPWKEEKSATIADNIAISCNASNKCTAWSSSASSRRPETEHTPPSSLSIIGTTVSLSYST